MNLTEADLIVRMGDIWQGESCRWYVKRFADRGDAGITVTLESMEGRITERPVSLAILFANYILIEPNTTGTVVWRDSKERVA